MPAWRQRVEQQPVAGSRRVRERPDEGCTRLRARQGGPGAPARVFRAVRPGHVLRVRRDSLVDVDGVLRRRSAGKALVARRAKRQRIRNGGRARRARGAERPRQGPPLEAHPVAALQRIEVAVFPSAAPTDQPEAGLDAMKQLVHEQPPALPLIILGDHLPVVRGPRDAAPLDRGVHKAERAGTVTSRRRLACRDRSSGGVRDYHGAAERHSPQPAAVTLAESLCFLEVLLGSGLIDLRHRRRRVAYNHIRQDCCAQR